MRHKRLTAIYLILSLLLLSVSVHADETISENGEDIVLSGEETMEPEEAYETVSEAGMEEAPEEFSEGEPEYGEETDISDILLEEAGAISEMEEGGDYADREGVFLADSYEEALNVASQYKAELKGYENGVATLGFGEATVDSLTSAAVRSAISSGSITKVVEPNFYFELDDTAYSNDPFLYEDSGCFQYGHKKIKDFEIESAVSGEGIRVAVIDTGVNPVQEDLQGKVNVRYISAVKSSIKNKNQYGVDQHGHGTHVCGLIAGIRNNGVGGCGIAPGVMIDSIQVSVTGSKFSLSDVAQGVKMAIALSDNVISMSLGADSNSAVLRQVIDEASSKGIICVAAAGNKSSTAKRYPASEDICISVASSTINGHLSPFSNYGDTVDIVAPGSTIYSTYLYSSSINSAVSKNRVRGTDMTNSYGKLSGTSQAVPVVASVAALVYGANPELFKNKNVDTVNFVREVLRYTSDGKDYMCVEADEDRKVTGLVQADKAVAYVRDIVPASSLSVIDSGGHYGPLVSGFLSKGKSLRISLGNGDGNKNKSLVNSAVWESTNPEMVTVKKGKIRCTKDAKAGDTAIITATVGGETVYFAVSVQDRVKKMGLYNSGNYRFTGNKSLNLQTGVSYNIAYPGSIASTGTVYLGYSTKKKELKDHLLDNTALSDMRYRYDISMSKSAMRNITVLESDTNGDPLRVIFNKKGKYSIRYKLLDGSGKSFSLKIKAG